MPAKKNLNGMRFGRLTVLFEKKERANGKVVWECQCSCGNIKSFTSCALSSRGTSSCGCLQREIAAAVHTTHGCASRKGETKLYKKWRDMRLRCSLTKPKKRKDFKYYAGKGVFVCEEWSEFIPFRDWAESNGYDKGLELDRIDNNLGYSPGNCQWISKADNIRKATVVRETNRRARASM